MHFSCFHWYFLHSTCQLQLSPQDATEYKQGAENIESHFQSLTNNFASFVATFQDWAKDKEGELAAQLKKANEVPIEFIDTLGMLYSTLIVGLILFRASTAAIAGIAISLDIVQDQVRDKERERDSLYEQIEQIQHTRQELKPLGEVRSLSDVGRLTIIASRWF
ncbi:hypothetical protein BBP40_001632 [Aspergillus hancockii]|nr:hypothetical protein BBP40_001632 [Aspergillus hancockii]